MQTRNPLAGSLCTQARIWSPELVLCVSAGGGRLYTFHPSEVTTGRGSECGSNTEIIRELGAYKSFLKAKGNRLFFILLFLLRISFF